MSRQVNINKITDNVLDQFLSIIKKLENNSGNLKYKFEKDFKLAKLDILNIRETIIALPLNRFRFVLDYIKFKNMDLAFKVDYIYIVMAELDFLIVEMVSISRNVIFNITIYQVESDSICDPKNVIQDMQKLIVHFEMFRKEAYFRCDFLTSGNFMKKLKSGFFIDQISTYQIIINKNILELENEENNNKILMLGLFEQWREFNEEVISRFGGLVWEPQEEEVLETTYYMGSKIEDEFIRRNK